MTSANARPTNFILLRRHQGFVAVVVLMLFVAIASYISGQNYLLKDKTNYLTNPASTPEPVTIPAFMIEVTESTWEWEDSEPVLYLTTKNTHPTLHTKQVTYQVTYHEEGVRDCTSKMLDSQETTVNVRISPGSVKRVRVPAETSLNPSQQKFTLCAVSNGALSE